MTILEVCANSVASALAAQAGGARRVELCTNLQQGGTTPSYGEIALARKLLHIKLYVLIRPRPGDFVYTDLEYDIMLTDVKQTIALGCDGIVIGILKADGSVDKARCKPLIDMAKAANLGVTFHRAFDMVNDQLKALEDIIDLGCARILTSGGMATAVEGTDIISDLVKVANGRIVIMPGSGINEANVTALMHDTGAAEFHASAKIKVGDSVLGFGDVEVTDDRLVRGLVGAIKI